MSIDLTISLVQQSAQSEGAWDALADRLNAALEGLTATQMFALRDLADQLAGSSRAGAERVLERIAGSRTGAGGWLRAMLLAAAGKRGEAATVLGTMPEMPWGDARSWQLYEWARNLARTGLQAEAWLPLRNAVKSAESFRLLRAADGLIAECRRKGAFPGGKRVRIALTGSFTLDFLRPALNACLFAAGIDADIFVGHFNQYQQEILDGNSDLALFRPDIVVIATDWRSLGFPEYTDAGDLASEQMASLRALWQRCRSWNAAVIQFNYEAAPASALGRMSSVMAGGRARMIAQLNAALFESERTEALAYILDVNGIAAQRGARQWDDAAAWHTSKQYPAAEAVPLLCRHMAALVRAILGMTSKCLVLDLDGVMWGGVIGEDGLNGIKLGASAAGESFVAFQAYAKALSQRGVLLAVCSKNNPEDALLPFEKHPEMVLKQEDIAAFVANWEPKDANIRSIAKLLNIGLDSLVFFDDNPAERARVRQLIPELEVVEVPADPADYVRALASSLLFETVSITGEDRLRTASIRDNLQRKDLEAAASDPVQYLRSLQMRLVAEPFDERNLPRIVQLINKTNQFNLTTRRTNDAEVRAWMADALCYTQCVRLSDRFGDLGLTGVLVALRAGDSLRIHSWLMSCRILGRGVEQAMLSATLAYAWEHGLGFVTGEFIPTAKNGQVRDVYGKFGFQSVETRSDGSMLFRIDRQAPPIIVPDYLAVEDRTSQQVKTSVSY